MQEMKLIDAVAFETAIEDFFKKQIDEEYLYLEVTDCNADISAILNALPSVPAVPLEVHERMKRELNTEIERFKKIETTINTFWRELRKTITAKGKETPTLEELLEHMENLKSEAIKEFAERLKAKSVKSYWNEYEIDRLVKEMVGDTE